MTGFGAQARPMTSNTTSQPVAPSVLLGDEDPRALFARAVALGTAVVGTVRPHQLDDPTPCDQYDVRQLLGHMIEVLRRVAAIGRGDNPFALPSVDAGTTGDVWLDAWRAAAHEVQAAWSDDATLTKVVVLPWSEASGGETLLGFVNEVTVHTWDLATSIGQRPAWDDRIVETAFAAIRKTLPAEGRAALFAAISAGMPTELRPSAPPFAEAVDVANDAPAIDRLVAWSGRQPR
jgi:uncharacterized protein (TIGR03086 family)